MIEAIGVRDEGPQRFRRRRKIVLPPVVELHFAPPLTPSYLPFGAGGTVWMYSHVAWISSSVSWLVYAHGMNGSILLLSGRAPVRSARVKSASVHVPMPVGVRFCALGKLGGVPVTCPPARFSPWQALQP